jgi:hypothetical protein
MAIKLVILVLKVVPLAIWAWRRMTLGPIANFSSAPNSQLQQISNSAGSAHVWEQCTKFGWPIEAWVQITLQRTRLFELGPQRGFSFSTDLKIGNQAFDETFFIGSESQHFIQLLAARSDVRQHFHLLRVRLDRYQAKLVRVRAEQRQLAVQCNVRWTTNRSKLYATLLEWLLELDALLTMTPPAPKQAQGTS